MPLLKGHRPGLKLYGTVKGKGAFCRVRLRIALIWCMVLSCSVSLVWFHILHFVKWGECIEFRALIPLPSTDPQNARRSPHWDFFDHIYCLHSHSAKEREADIHRSLEQLHLLDDIHWWDTEIDKENGHRGAWNAHKSIAQHAIDNNFTKVLIFEDDILIEPFLERGVDGVMQRVVNFLTATPTWEVFFLSHNCKGLELTINPEFVRVNSWSTVAYSLNKHGILKLAQSEFIPENTVDSLLYENVHAYAIYPMVIEHKPNHSYTIKSNRTEDVNKLWRRAESLLHSKALERNMYACSSPSRQAWGHLLYRAPRL